MRQAGLAEIGAKVDQVVSDWFGLGSIKRTELRAATDDPWIEGLYDDLDKLALIATGRKVPA